MNKQNKLFSDIDHSSIETLETRRKNGELVAKIIKRKKSNKKRSKERSKF